MSDECFITPRKNAAVEGLTEFDADRVKLTLSVYDRAQFDALPRGRSTATAIVTDLTTLRRLEVARAGCGASCYCAAAIVRELPHPSRYNGEVKVQYRTAVHETSERNHLTGRWRKGQTVRVITVFAIIEGHEIVLAEKRLAQ